MKKIEEIDKNFAIQPDTGAEHTRAYHVCTPPFSLHGIFAPDATHGKFYRLPLATAQQVSEGVGSLCANCAGGRVRFKTDSSYIAIRGEMGGVGKMPHFALTGSAGFDLYLGDTHVATFVPPFHITKEFFGEYRTEKGPLREYTLNFPLYSEVVSLEIVLDEDAAIEAADAYGQQGKPVVFYGSSITQGGCASRPGTSYTSLISRRLNVDYWNLGFSGSAKGEPAMAAYIGGLDMLAFVLDYDYNAPTKEHLQKTHDAFIQKVRETHPLTPIICLSAPSPSHKDHGERAAVIANNVSKRKTQGDSHIYYLDMSDYLLSHGVLQEATVDRCHPNDLGFYFMAQAVGDCLREILDPETT